MAMSKKGWPKVSASSGKFAKNSGTPTQKKSRKNSAGGVKKKRA